jgi:hypothetical protein
MICFLSGIFVGAFIGVIIAALLSMARDEEE